MCVLSKASSCLPAPRPAHPPGLAQSMSDNLIYSLTYIRNNPSFQIQSLCLNAVDPASLPSRLFSFFSISMATVSIQALISLHLISSPSKPVWQTPAQEGPVEYKSDVMALLEVSVGLLRAFGIKSDLPHLSLLCLCTQAPFPHPHPSQRHPHTLPSSNKEGPFAVLTSGPLFIQLPQPPSPSTWQVLIRLSSLIDILNITPSSESFSDYTFPDEDSDHPSTDAHTLFC